MSNKNHRPIPVTTELHLITEDLSSNNAIIRQQGYDRLFHVFELLATDISGHGANEMVDAAIEAGFIRDAIKNAIEKWAAK